MLLSDSKRRSHYFPDYHYPGDLTFRTTSCCCFIELVIQFAVLTQTLFITTSFVCKPRNVSIVLQQHLRCQKGIKILV